MDLSRCRIPLRDQGLGKVFHSSCWLGVLSGLGDELEWSQRVSGVVSEGCGDADSSGQAMEADRGVAQRGHHGGAVPGVELVTVLVEGHIPDPVQPVLDTPMTLDEVSEVSGAGLAGIEGGDQVNHLHGLAAVDGASTAQLCDLTGTRPVDPVRDLTDLDRAPHAPAMTGGRAVVGGDVLPGQGLERGPQAGLVAFHRQHVVMTLPGKGAGSGALGV